LRQSDRRGPSGLWSTPGSMRQWRKSRAMRDVMMRSPSRRGRPPVRWPLAPVGLVGLGEAVQDGLADSPAQRVEVQVGGEAGRAAVLVARVEDEVERLLDPLRLPLPPEVVEHQMLAAGQELQQVVEALGLVGGEGAPGDE